MKKKDIINSIKNILNNPDHKKKINFFINLNNLNNKKYKKYFYYLFQILKNFFKKNNLNKDIGYIIENIDSKYNFLNISLPSSIILASLGIKICTCDGLLNNVNIIEKLGGYIKLKKKNIKKIQNKYNYFPINYSCSKIMRELLSIKNNITKSITMSQQTIQCISLTHSDIIILLNNNYLDIIYT